MVDETSSAFNLREKCRQAIRKGNLEKCFDLLDEALTRGEETEAIRNELIQQEGRLNRAMRERRLGVSDAYEQVYNQISNDVLTLLDNLEDKHLTLLNRINDQILIIAPESRVANWQALFSDKNFSHALVLSSGKEVPLAYSNPDVVVFDDSGPDVRPEMVRFAAAMPQAHFLYFGNNNPFTESRKRNQEDAAIFERCANANSKFTVHARLRELLEFRKIYGTQ
jgi:hypothetical protein